MCYGAIIQGGGGGNVVSAAHPYASHLVLLIELHICLNKNLVNLGPWDWARFSWLAVLIVHTSSSTLTHIG